MSRYDGNAHEFRRLISVWLWGAARDRRNSVVLTIWALIWCAVYSVTLLTIRMGLAGGILAWGLVAASAVTGVTALWTFVRFVSEADELMRRVYVNGLAFGFAAGVVFQVTSKVAEAMGGPIYGTSEMFAVMCLAFAGKLLWNLWRTK